MTARHLGKTCPTCNRNATQATQIPLYTALAIVILVICLMLYLYTCYLRATTAAETCFNVRGHYNNSSSSSSSS
jgi:hypothetical protein